MDRRRELQDSNNSKYLIKLNKPIKKRSVLVLHQFCNKFDITVNMKQFTGSML